MCRHTLLNSRFCRNQLNESKMRWSFKEKSSTKNSGLIIFAECSDRDLLLLLLLLLFLQDTAVSHIRRLLLLFFTPAAWICQLSFPFGAGQFRRTSLFLSSSSDFLFDFPFSPPLSPAKFILKLFSPLETNSSLQQLTLESLAKHLTIWKPRNKSINKFYVDWKSLWTNLKALNLQSVWSELGGEEEALRTQTIKTLHPLHGKYMARNIYTVSFPLFSRRIYKKVCPFPVAVQLRRSSKPRSSGWYMD